jgi:hypothetical protein
MVWFMAATTSKGRKRGTTMSKEHKAALAAGRDDARLIKAYLEALEASAPRRGRRRTKEGIKKRLTAIERALPTASVLMRVQLLQEQADLEAELSSQGAPATDVERLRRGFVKAARRYSERKGITYATWRSVGVDAATLKEAGISRTG